MSMTLVKSARFDDIVAAEIAGREGRDGGVMGSAAEDIIGSTGSMGSLRHYVGGSGPEGVRGSRCGPIETGQRQLGSCTVRQAFRATFALLSEFCVIEDRRTSSHLAGRDLQEFSARGLHWHGPPHRSVTLCCTLLEIHRTRHCRNWQSACIAGRSSPPRSGKAPLGAGISTAFEAAAAAALGCTAALAIFTLVAAFTSVQVPFQISVVMSRASGA